MLAAVKDELQTEFEKVPAQISHAYFKLTRDYLLLLCDLREMIELGYPIRLINDRAAQQSCSSKVPKVQKAPSQKPCREQDGRKGRPGGGGIYNSLVISRSVFGLELDLHDG